MKFKHALAIAFAALALMCIFGCSPSKIKAKAMAEYKESPAFPGDCADKFPVRIDTTFIEGKSTYDTIWSYDTDIRYDTVINQQETIIYRDRIKVQKVTITRIDTLRIDGELTARIEEQRRIAAQYLALATDNGKNAAMWKKRAKDRLLWFFIAIGAVGAYTFLKIRKLIPF